MIISPKHKYVFVENPRTASTAVARELVDHYDGEPILYKHAMYPHFAKWARQNARKYIVVGGIRNPMDAVVSEYFKLKNDHKGKLSDPACMRRNGGWIQPHVARQFAFIQNTNADFASYFKKFYRFPHVDRSILTGRHFDFVLRYENLQDDFGRLLQTLGIEQVRPIPVINRTTKSIENFSALYAPDLHRRAVFVLGPIMAMCGYRFPENWYVTRIPAAAWGLFYVRYAAMIAYWKHAAFNEPRALRKTYAAVVPNAS